MNMNELARWALIQHATKEFAAMPADDVDDHFDELVSSLTEFDAFAGVVNDYIVAVARVHVEQFPRLQEVLLWQASSGVGVTAVLRIKHEMSQLTPNWHDCFTDIQTYAFS